MLPPPGYDPDRPSSWAEHVFFPGLPNLWQVSPRLYRGAEPTPEGIKRLAWMGVEMIIDLEAWFDFNPFEWYRAKKAGVGFKSLPCNPWHPELEDVYKFLSIAHPTNGDCRPCFLHCKQGSDRTGMMVAAYRIFAQGWTPELAIEEMVNGGFGFHGTMWPQIVPFVRGL
jgi:protein tyrosine/serine phosphatase